MNNLKSNRMKIKMKYLGVLGVLAICLSFAFKPLNDKRIIVIDAGHGGKDFGAQMDGELEKKIVENIADKISILNRDGEIEIVLLRDDDRFIELSERVTRINKINPSLLISLHVNASKNLNENGVNAYVSRQNKFYDRSKESAKRLVEKLANEKLAKGEVKDANFFVIKNSKCPALVLEVGYLSNVNDKNYITSENGQNEIANQILEFIKK
jgi:N-acetylmuramoyl-L-alanine amidase